MPISFPLGWKLAETKICSLCIRECVEKKMNEYYGLVGSKVCESCGRFCCELHTTEVKENVRLCLDCFHHVGRFDKLNKK